MFTLTKSLESSKLESIHLTDVNLVSIGDRIEIILKFVRCLIHSSSQYWERIEIIFKFVRCLIHSYGKTLADFGGALKKQEFKIEIEKDSFLVCANEGSWYVDGSKFAYFPPKSSVVFCFKLIVCQQVKSILVQAYTFLFQGSLDLTQPILLNNDIMFSHSLHRIKHSSVQYSLN